MEIRTSIQINASKAEVWSVLTDFAKYPEWNPFIKSLEGEVEVGNQINVSLPGMNFKPEVLEFDQNKVFEWKGKLLIKGLFDGAHRFELNELEDGTTEFIHSEQFNGILVKPLMKKIGNQTKSGFIAMNEALKARTENLD